MRNLIAALLLAAFGCLTAQTKLSLIFKKQTEVFNESDSAKISQSPESFYYLNLTKTISEYFHAVEKEVDGKTWNYPSGYLYKNIQNNTFTKQSEGSEEFVHGNLTSFDWVLKPISKKVLGYPVKKAILEISRQKQIIAWYSNMKYPNGPEMYYGLPGLILEIEEIENNNGRIQKTIITALSIDLSKDTKSIHNPASQK